MLSHLMSSCFQAGLFFLLLSLRDSRGFVALSGRISCRQLSKSRASQSEESYIYSEIGLKKKLADARLPSYEDQEIAGLHAAQNLTDGASLYSSSTKLQITNENVKSKTQDSERSTKEASPATEKKLLPFFELESIGAVGRWVERSGNFLLFPRDTSAPPKGVIHFLGGAFVGAAPHITYRYLLEALSESGFLIVATPYRLDMDYLRSCDGILAKFDAVAVELARDYGPLPVIGLGHSCGALLQTLITSLFPEAPRAINVLISFNNRPVTEAIPAFEELIVPLSEQIMGDADRSVKFRDSVRGLRSNAEGVVGRFARSQLAPVFLSKELLPLFRQTVEVADQIPPLLKIIAQGQREFEPTPKDTKEVCRRMYRARRTLLIKFENDELDESEDVEKVLREANTIMRMKWPMREMEVSLRVLQGTHITPLTQNLILEPPANLPLLQPLIEFNEIFLNPLRSQYRENFLTTINLVKEEILSFLDSSFKQ